MDVTRLDFSRSLPTILKNIAGAHFLSFDLELSGIPDQRRNRGQAPKSLADRYKELKEAAATYHILQVGLTCVEEDRTGAKYVIRSYNFNISPLVDDQLDLERNFTYSTGAVDFLLRHDYQIQAPFISGIPYLTRSESALAMDNALARWDRQAIPDIKIKHDDAKALTFMQRVREEIDAWQKTGSPSKDAYDIVGVPLSSSNTNSVVPLNRFEKRLVHQIVRTEFPQLQTFSRTDGVQVQPLNKEEQRRIQETLHRRLKSTVSNQIGFRWIAEAMAGGDLSGLDYESVGPIQGEKAPSSREASHRRMDTLLQSLKARKKVLVGHNCLLDLMYFFQTFYGPLPDTIEDFVRQVQDVFPLMIDTKYLSTNPGSSDALRFRNSQLWQIDQALAELEKPILECAQDVKSYEDSEQYHEAGFDSFVTAKVFLRLASKIALEHPSLWSTAKGHSEEVEVAQAKASKKKRNKSNQNAQNNQFFHPNTFQGLSELDNAEADTSRSVLHPSTETPASTSAALPLRHEDQVVDDEDVDRLTRSIRALRMTGDNLEGSLPGLIPRWDTQFWATFGNRLRVYGTLEEECRLADAELSQGVNTMEASGLEGTHPPNKRRRSILDGLKEAMGKLF